MQHATCERTLKLKKNMKTHNKSSVLLYPPNQLLWPMAFSRMEPGCVEEKKTLESAKRSRTAQRLDATKPKALQHLMLYLVCSLSYFQQ